MEGASAVLLNSFPASVMEAGFLIDNSFMEQRLCLPSGIPLPSQNMKKADDAFQRRRWPLQTDVRRA